MDDRGDDENNFGLRWATATHIRHYGVEMHIHPYRGADGMVELKRIAASMGGGFGRPTSAFN